MDYFNDVYRKRVNRWGTTYQERITGQREELFNRLLDKSLYRIDFLFNGNIVPAIFEKYQQDNSKTLHYLLTSLSIDIPNGTLFEVTNKTNNSVETWMVFWKERLDTSGYNRYVALKMTHYLKWKDKKTGYNYESWAYFFGKQSQDLKDTIIKNNQNMSIYEENLIMNSFIMPLNEHIKKETYLTLGEGELKEGYWVKGFDRQSTPGVQFVSVDPIFLLNEDPKPETDENDYWLNGGD